MGKILGEPFKKYVIDQINQRQNAHGSGTTTNRTPDQLAYLNSKTAWIKLASGTKITPDRVSEEKIRKGFAWESLARQNVLFGGVAVRRDNSEPLSQRGTDPSSKYDNIVGNFWGTYNVNATDSPISEFGLVPMPGITGAEIKCVNRGSIKKATVNIKCYSPEQFQIIDLLYLRIGYTVLLEWGNSLYLDGGKIQRQSYTLVEEEKYGFFSPKWSNTSYSGFLPMIEQYRKARLGNYDGLLAKVVNFSWTFSQDGSYDISLELISLGDVIESLKLNISPSYEVSNTINTLYSLYSEDTGDTNDKSLTASPANNVISSYLFLQKIFSDSNQNPEGPSGGERMSNKQVTAKINGTPIKLGGTFIVPPKDKVITLDPVYSDSPEFDTVEQLEEYMANNYPNHKKFANTGNGFPTADDNIWFSNGTQARIKTILDPLKIEKLSGKGDVVYMAYNTGQDDEDLIVDSGFYMRWGHLLHYIDSKVIPVIKNTGNSSGNPQTKIININSDTWGNRMYTLPYQVSLDPRVCLINAGEDVNKKTYFAELDPFKNTAYDYGWTMNIYLSHNQILTSLNENLDEKGNVSIFDFLNSLCVAVNKALGGINNLEPFLDEDTNTIYIIDASYQGKVKKNPYNLELFGYNGNQSGFVRNFDLKTEITSDFATMASIGSTAGGYVKGTENTMFSKWNKGLIDRWKEEYEPADKTSRPTPGSTDEPVKAYVESFWVKGESSFGYTLMDITNDSSWFGYGEAAAMSDELIDNNISVVTEFYKYCQSKIQDKYSGKYSSPSNGFIPISLGITMDGISGIKIYNEVNVDTRFLPRNYPDNLRFIIKGVNHKLSGHDWETTLETVVIAKSQDDEASITQKEIKSIIDAIIGGASIGRPDPKPRQSPQTRVTQTNETNTRVTTNEEEETNKEKNDPLPPTPNKTAETYTKEKLKTAPYPIVVQGNYKALDAGDSFHSFDKRGSDKFGGYMFLTESIPENWKNRVSRTNSIGQVLTWLNQNGRPSEIKKIIINLYFDSKKVEWRAIIDKSTDGKAYVDGTTRGGINGGGRTFPTLNLAQKIDPYGHPAGNSPLSSLQIDWKPVFKSKSKPIPIEVYVKNNDGTNSTTRIQNPNAPKGAIEILNKEKTKIYLRQYFHQDYY